MSIVCNENVNCEWSYDYAYGSVYRFYPDEGYALWRDNEEGNLDEETGEAMCYWHQILTDKPEEYAPHIWAVLIDETMEEFGKENEAGVMTLDLDDEEEEVSHTYVDKNGVVRNKKGVY